MSNHTAADPPGRLDWLFLTAAAAVALWAIAGILTDAHTSTETALITGGLIVTGTLFNLWRGHL